MCSGVFISSLILKFSQTVPCPKATLANIMIPKKPHNGEESGLDGLNTRRINISRVSVYSSAFRVMIKNNTVISVKFRKRFGTSRDALKNCGICVWNRFSKRAQEEMRVPDGRGPRANGGMMRGRGGGGRQAVGGGHGGIIRGWGRRGRGIAVG